jgi:hypothetical protein
MSIFARILLAVSVPLLRLFLFGVALSVMSGCVSKPEYAKAEDPFKIGNSVSQSPFASVKLCLLFTENTQKTFDNLKQNNDGIIVGTAMSGFDSKSIVADLTNMLQSRFREVTQIRSASELQSRGCNLAFFLELKIIMTPGLSKKGFAEINAKFVDSKGELVDLISNMSNKESWGSIGDAAASAWNAVLDDFSNNLDKSKPLLTFASTLQIKSAIPDKVTKPSKAPTERLVLMPLRVGEEDKTLEGAMETALVQGLQQNYVVFSGEQVAQKAREIFLKESRNTAKKECDETRCMQGIAEAFQAELIATANVTKRDGGYFLALSIRNIFDNKVVYSNSVACKGCDTFQVVDKLKELSSQ